MTHPTIHRTALCACLLMVLGACAKTPAPPTAGAPDGAPAVNASAAPLDQPAADVPPATAAAPTAPQVAPASGLERMDGYGDMRFGMTADETKKAWGGELSGVPADGTTCYFLSPAWVKVPSELAFMIEGDRFVRYSTTLAKGTAPGGGKVGMTSDAIKALYGARVTAMPHKYVEGGQNLTVADDAGGTGKLVFETSKDGVVATWRVGVPPQVDYVEGCS